jgi:anaerobic selenocysteine-containing dehydrogenase
VGCGQLVYAKGNRILDIEGDPDSPISTGRLCPKGAATFQLVTGSHRVKHALYRRPGGKEWEAIPLERAMDRVAMRVAQTREETWEEEDEKGTHVKRTLGIAHLGGLIRYVIENARYFREYVLHYTNAATRRCRARRTSRRSSGISPSARSRGATRCAARSKTCPTASIQFGEVAESWGAMALAALGAMGVALGVVGCTAELLAGRAFEAVVRAGGVSAGEPKATFAQQRREAALRAEAASRSSSARAPRARR